MRLPAFDRFFRALAPAMVGFFATPQISLAAVEVRLGDSGIALGKQVNGALDMKVNGTGYRATTDGGSTTGISLNGTYPPSRNPNP